MKARRTVACIECGTFCTVRDSEPPGVFYIICGQCGAFLLVREARSFYVFDRNQSWKTFDDWLYEMKGELDAK